MGARGKSKYKIGQKFGHLTLKEYCPGERPARWIVRCDCGYEYKAYSSNVYTGKSTRCVGCQNKLRSITSTQDLIGKRYGKLVVVERDDKKKKWLCLCNCGNTCYRTTNGLNYIKKRKMESHCQKCNRVTGKVNRTPDDLFTAQRKRRQVIHESRVGKRFRRYRILSFYYKNVETRNRCFYKCKCKCGNFFEMRSDQLEGYWSCGCYQKEVSGRRQVRLIEKDEGVVCLHLLENCGYTRQELADIYGVSYVYMCKAIKDAKDHKGEILC